TGRSVQGSGVPRTGRRTGGRRPVRNSEARPRFRRARADPPIRLGGSVSATTPATHTFRDALAGRPQARPPIWCMRQAGRYQRAYRALRERYSFEDLCRDPELSARVALAAIEDFDFDAAILFSDLLFPLDAIGLGLTYEDAGPR